MAASKWLRVFSSRESLRKYQRSPSRPEQHQTDPCSCPVRGEWHINTHTLWCVYGVKYDGTKNTYV